MRVFDSIDGWGRPEKFRWMKARERLLQDTPISAEHLAVLADRGAARLPAA